MQEPMQEEKTEVKNLSSALLQLKFMQRTKVRLDETEKKKNEQKLQENFQKGKRGRVAEMPPKDPVIKIENSYDIMEGLVFGRMSFKGFNPETERWMQYHKDIREGRTPREALDDFNENELADSISNATSIAKKFRNRDFPDDDTMDF